MLYLLQYPNYWNLQIDIASEDFLSFLPAIAGAKLGSEGGRWLK